MIFKCFIMIAKIRLRKSGEMLMRPRPGRIKWEINKNRNRLERVPRPKKGAQILMPGLSVLVALCFWPVSYDRTIESAKEKHWKVINNEIIKTKQEIYDGEREGWKMKKQTALHNKNKTSEQVRAVPYLMGDLA